MEEEEEEEEEEENSIASKNDAAKGKTLPVHEVDKTDNTFNQTIPLGKTGKFFWNKPYLFSNHK